MTLSEKRIVRKIKEGDVAVFESLFKKYYECLCDFGSRYLRDMEVTEEIIQDTFYKIWKNRGELSISTSLKAYLYTAVRNNCLQELRTRSLDVKYANYYKTN